MEDLKQQDLQILIPPVIPQNGIIPQWSIS